MEYYGEVGEDMLLKIDELEMKYGRHIALKRIDLELTPGLYALLGPNGSGKSTLMNLITLNLRPSFGEIYYNGKRTVKLGKKFRSVLGFMPQQQGLYDNFTGYRFLSYMAALKGMDSTAAEVEIKRVLGLVNLMDEANRPLGEYSGGMKQRILIAQAVMNDPEILILDEPTAGLDPKERMRIRNLVSEIAGGKIVLFATHVVSDIEHIAKEIILISDGLIIGQEEPDRFIEDLRGKVHTIRADKPELEEIKGRFRVVSIKPHGGEISVRVLSDSAPEGYESSTAEPDLEDVYLFHFQDEERVL